MTTFTGFSRSKRTVAPALRALTALLVLDGCSASFDSCEKNGTCVPNRVTPDGGTGGGAGSGSSSGGAGAGGQSAGGASGMSSGGSPGAGGGSAGSSGGSAGTEGGGGTDAGATPVDAGADAPAACDGKRAPGAATCVIDEQFGVFVSPNGSDATGDGSRLHPYATITKGLGVAHAETKRVYVCSTQGPFNEALNIDATLDGSVLYGRFDCGTWTYGAGLATVDSPTGVALTVKNLVLGLHVEDFVFQSANGTTNAPSSIAAIVSGSENVIFTHDAFKAGTGAAGGDGTGTSTKAEPGVDGIAGAPVLCTTLAPVSGFEGPETLCEGLPSGSKGGNGGYGSDTQGGSPPDPGLKGAPTALSGGAGGAAETPTTSCQNGQPGLNGTSRPVGAGGKIGAFDASGYHPQVGTGGLAGTVGQGGGGGGGRLSPDCNGGAGGGSGGSGGCGGRGGTGGKGGGASIALATVNSSITLEACSLIAQAGGAGGKGGPGQPGGKGGLYSQGGEQRGPANVAMGYACDGAQGGDGGDGGHGGGGAGGPSIGIASVGTAPTQSGTTVQVATTPAPGGADGSGATTGSGAGAAGVVANAYDF